MDQAKAVTAMYHFNTFGCRVGKSALEIKKELQDIQKKKLIDARMKEERAYNDRKAKYEEVMMLNIEDDKLSAAQLEDFVGLEEA